jgi:CRP-like cAMP-binding protein
MTYQAAVLTSSTFRRPPGADVAARQPPSTALSRLERLGARIVIPGNRTVIEEDDSANHVFKVVSGALRMVRLLSDGRRHLSSFLMPEDFFGWTERDVYSYSVESVSDATLMRYPRQDFEALLNSDPSISHRFLSLVCGQLAETQDRLLLLGRMTATERLAAFLLGMADRRSGKDQGGAVELPMNRGDIADYLGLTVETVSRALTRLRSRRIIDLPTANHIVFLKRQALEQISAGEE